MHRWPPLPERNGFGVLDHMVVLLTDDVQLIGGSVPVLCQQWVGLVRRRMGVRLTM